jgi:hypothetical protein
VFGLGLAATLLVATGQRTTAHEIPADVTVHMYVVPAGSSLQVLVRAPLASMRDVLFPTRGAGFLELPPSYDAARLAAELWIANEMRAFEGGRDLGRPVITAVQLSQPSDRSMASWAEAEAHVRGPRLPDDAELLETQALLDVLVEFPVQADASRFAIETTLSRLGLRTRTVLRFVPPAGPMRAFEFMGDAGRLELDPQWHQAAVRFVVSGVQHILGGLDHLLFIVCLAVPLRRFKPLVVIVTAFTVAHSLTLIAAALGLAPEAAWFPPLIETLIALSIVWMALENIVGSANMRRRWVMTFLFGLIHGFGFSFALRETLQFGGAHLMTSLLTFNVGVELGQIAALLVIVPAAQLLFRFVVSERIGGILIAALVAHQAWHWMLGRGADLFAHDFPLTGADTMRFALRGAIVAWLLGWLVWYRRRSRSNEPMGQ